MPSPDKVALAAQRRRRKAAGFCVSCGKSRVNATHCAYCQKAHNARRRAYTAANQRFPLPGA